MYWAHGQPGIRLPCAPLPQVHTHASHHPVSVVMRPCGSALSIGFPASFLAQYPARQARLKERSGPDAPAQDVGVLGCVQLGAGEDVVVAIQAADDQHLLVLEPGSP
jgi:hypothetical protein